MISPNLYSTSIAPHELVIIGAGPVGLYASYFANLRNIQHVVISSKLGGQPKYLYPNSNIYDIPGFQKIQAKELIDNLYNQARYHNDNFRVYPKDISRVCYENDLLRLHTSNKEIIYTKYLLLCTGIGTPIKREMKTLNGEVVKFGYPRGIDVTEGYQYIIFGGGNDAIDQALMLTQYPYNQNHNEIHVISRSKLKGFESNIKKLGKHNIHIYENFDVERVTDTNLILRKNNEEQFTFRIPFWQNKDYVYQLNCLGYDTVRNLEFDFVEVPEMIGNYYKTNEFGQVVNDIFAAGDCAYSPGTMRLIATGFSQAATSVSKIRELLGGRMFEGFSSNLQEENDEHVL